MSDFIGNPALETGNKSLAAARRDTEQQSVASSASRLTAAVALLALTLGGCAFSVLNLAADLAVSGAAGAAGGGLGELPDLSQGIHFRARPSPPQEPIAPTCMAGYVSIRSGFGWRCAEVGR